MSAGDIHIRIAGRAGRITLCRPAALNALTWPMCQAIDQALAAWAGDDRVALVIIDAAGERAFCAGGDIARMYATASAGDFAYGRRFWAEEYRLNARIAGYPKPYVAFMQGFTMGGGVGISCHGTHRVVGASSRIAMPECGIGLVPDVGGSLLLGRAPGRLGEYLGTTGRRMTGADAIHAGFADHFIPEAAWPALIAALQAGGDVTVLDRAAQVPPAAPLVACAGEIDRHFGGETIWDILRSLRQAGGDFAEETCAALAANSPLSVACTIELVHRARGSGRIEDALEQEYRFVWRAAEQGDFVEGIRAAIIDKDRAPRWRHAELDALRQADVVQMLMPLGDKALKLKEE